MKVEAVCSSPAGHIFTTTISATSVQDALTRIQHAVNHEFDHCFEADQWSSLTITITRKA